MERIEKKVLCIDDNSVITDILSKFLKPTGCEVEVAKNGKEGLQKLDKFKPGLIISDFEMSPGIDGVELYVAMSEKTGGVPILVVSGREVAYIRKRIEDAVHSVRGILQKPIRCAVLRKKVNEIFSTQSESYQS